MGKTVEHSTELKDSISEEVVDLSRDSSYNVLTGDTMACDDFYEGTYYHCFHTVFTVKNNTLELIYSHFIWINAPIFLRKGI